MSMTDTDTAPDAPLASQTLDGLTALYDEKVAQGLPERCAAELLAEIDAGTALGREAAPWRSWLVTFSKAWEEAESAG